MPVEAPDEPVERGWGPVVGDGGEHRGEDAPVGAAVAQGDAVAVRGDPVAVGERHPGGSSITDEGQPCAVTR